ncbi:hypothetical protein [Nocardia cyriacigeorgica]|uniref:hypothetical protein n=1 Tax=Nocardia cyriacigeorgica TaxID=135487 RepID=UPI003EDFA9B9
MSQAAVTVCGVTDFEVPQSWAEARPLLRPVLRPVTYRGTVPAADQPLGRTVLPFVDELVAVDLPDRRTIVNDDHRAAWGVSADELFEAALANLSAMAQLPELEADSVLHFVDDGDGYSRRGCWFRAGWRPSAPVMAAGRWLSCRMWTR